MQNDLCMQTAHLGGKTALRLDPLLRDSTGGFNYPPRFALQAAASTVTSTSLVFLLPLHDDRSMTVDTPTCQRCDEVVVMLPLSQLQHQPSDNLEEIIPASLAPVLYDPDRRRRRVVLFVIDMTYVYQTSSRLTLPPFSPASSPTDALPHLFSSRRTSPMMRLTRFWASSRPLIMPRVSLTISQIILRLLRRRRADPVPIPSNNRTSPSLTTPGQDGRRRARNPSRHLLHFGAVLPDIPAVTDILNVARESDEDAVKICFRCPEWLEAFVQISHEAEPPEASVRSLAEQSDGVGLHP
ncbi:hypothetical protein EV121DRAFT_297397 [Schizophyllum commune]